MAITSTLCLDGDYLLNFLRGKCQLIEPLNFKEVFNKHVLSASTARPAGVPSAAPLGTAPLCWWLKAHWRRDWGWPHAVQEGKRS